MEALPKTERFLGDAFLLMSIISDSNIIISSAEEHIIITIFRSAMDDQMEEINMVKDINTKVSQQWRMAILTGYQPITNYWDRFNESERLGVLGIFDCYTKMLDESKGNCRKLIELAIVTNHKAYEMNEALANITLVNCMTIEDIEAAENIFSAYSQLFNITKMIALETLEWDEKMEFLSDID